MLFYFGCEKVCLWRKGGDCSSWKEKTSSITNRHEGKRFVTIRSNRKYQRRIDSSWVYWTTLVISGAFLSISSWFCELTELIFVMIPYISSTGYPQKRKGLIPVT